MDTVLCLKSALEIYHAARISDENDDGPIPDGRRVPVELVQSQVTDLPMHTPSTREPRLLERRYSNFEDAVVDGHRIPVPGLSSPVHLLMHRNASNTPVDGRKVFRLNQPLVDGSLIRFESDVLLSSPEHIYLHAAPYLDDIGLAWLASELCGLYTVHPNASSTLLPARPLTTAPRLKAYLSKAAGSKMRGVNKAQRSLSLAFEGTASPRELATAFFLSVPRSQGGRAVPKPVPNYIVKVDRRICSIHRWDAFCVDLCWPEAKLALEYDSDAYHMNPRRRAYDNDKRPALEEMGWRVIPFSTEQFDNLQLADDTFQRVAKHLGIRNRATESKYDWQARRSVLYRRLWTLLHEGGAIRELVKTLDSKRP